MQPCSHFGNFPVQRNSVDDGRILKVRFDGVDCRHCRHEFTLEVKVCGLVLRHVDGPYRMTDRNDEIRSRAHKAMGEEILCARRFGVWGRESVDAW